MSSVVTHLLRDGLHDLVVAKGAQQPSNVCHLAHRHHHANAVARMPLAVEGQARSLARFRADEPMLEPWWGAPSTTRRPIDEGRRRRLCPQIQIYICGRVWEFSMISRQDGRRSDRNTKEPNPRTALLIFFIFCEAHMYLAVDQNRISMTPYVASSLPTVHSCSYETA